MGSYGAQQADEAITKELSEQAIILHSPIQLVEAFHNNRQGNGAYELLVSWKMEWSGVLHLGAIDITKRRCSGNDWELLTFSGWMRTWDIYFE